MWPSAYLTRPEGAVQYSGLQAPGCMNRVLSYLEAVGKGKGMKAGRQGRKMQTALHSSKTKTASENPN